jgi:DNA-binding NarL/FixJ family response regulator
VTPALIARAQEHGIGGCLTKHLAADRLVIAIERVHLGHVVVEHSPRTEPSAPAASPVSPLTPREASVIRLITNGLSNEEIAFHLNLSINSVKSYIRSTYRKIEAGSRAQAVVWGVRNGYLSEQEEAAGLGYAS